MERKTMKIAGHTEFQYTGELLSLAMARTRADLYAEVSKRQVYGRSTMNKEQLAVVVVDGYLQELDAAAEQKAADVQFEKYVTEKAPTAAARIFVTICDHGHTREEGCPEAPCWVTPVDAADLENERNLAAAAGLDVHAVGVAHADVPANLCAHGIDASRRCSICAEDAAERPVPLNTWLEAGIVLVDPRSVRGQRYRFDRWTRFGAKLINMDNGGVRIVLQSAVVMWSYLPKMSTEGIERAKIDNRPRVGDIVKHHAGDRREFTVRTVHAGGEPLVLLDDNSNVWVAMAHLRVVRRAKDVPTDGTCRFGNIHAIETCPGCGTEDDQGNQVVPTTRRGDQRPRCGVEMPRCGVEMPPIVGMAAPRVCNLVLNADGVCLDTNHRPALQ